ncbi:MAG: hypothetical protein ORN85_00690 [Sediminibacterium sp.]|nr:hypothetical protein [Sediminibacterium sp.]
MTNLGNCWSNFLLNNSLNFLSTTYCCNRLLKTYHFLRTSIEEIRPIFVRKTSRTKGHEFVCMIAYILVKEIETRCKDLGFTRKAIIDYLNQLQYIKYQEQKLEIKILPTQFNEQLGAIVKTLNLILPDYL